MRITDTHTHTNFSFDGDNTPREMLDKAVELGVYALTFTDHADVNGYYDSYYNESKLMPKAAKAIPPLIDEYKDRLRLGFGAEIGQFVQDEALAKKLLRDFKFDFVIGSIHSVRGHEDFFFLEFDEQNTEKYLQAYFDDTLEMVNRADIDVIGHLTYPLRYIVGKYNINPDMTKYEEIIRHILKTAADRGIGLEINTAGLRKPEYNSPDPPLEYVKIFRELGGEIVTIGSDAHRISDLAVNFTVGADIAKAAGFTKTAFFEKRQPVFVGL